LATFPYAQIAKPLFLARPVNKRRLLIGAFRWTFGLVSRICGFGANSTIPDLPVLTIAGTGMKQFADIFRCSAGRGVRI
jgi:hypothetical protein